MKRNDELWQIFQTINEWVRFSDVKAAALLGIQGLFIGFLADNRAACIKLTGASAIFFIAGLVINALSVVFAFLCLNPSLKLKMGESSIYFGSIAKNFSSADHYQKHLHKAFDSDEDVEREVCGQVYENAKIAERKFRLVAWSLRFFVLSLTFWAVVVISKL